MQQTTLTRFFTGVKGTPIPRMEKKKRSASQARNKSKVPSEYESCSEYQGEKRHLEAPIISDDEDEGSTITVNKPKRLRYSPVKKKSTIDFRPSLLSQSDPKSTTIASTQEHIPKLVKRKLPVAIESSSSESEEQEMTTPQIDDTFEQIDDTFNATIPENTDADLNFTTLNVIRKFISTALQSGHLKCLLCDEDKRLFRNFLSTDAIYQYTCLKLCMYKRSWYNVFKYCRKIGLKIGHGEIVQMYNCFKQNEFVLTNYGEGDLGILLHCMDKNDVKEIYQSFKLKGNVNKDLMIGKLLKFCSTQSTLTAFKSTEQLLRERIQEKMGYAVKLSDKFYDPFFRVYLLNTFTNKNYTNPKDYFNSLGQKIVYPEHGVEEYRIFHTQEEFLKYVEAMRCYNEFEKALEAKNLEDMFKMCKLAFDMLQQLAGDREKERSRLPFLRRFTASAQYASILTVASKHLTSAYFDQVVIWLSYLLDHNLNVHRRSVWYCRLAKIQTANLKDYTAAARTVLKALEERADFSEIQMHDLAERGRILGRKTYKVPQDYLETINDLLPPKCEKKWPEVVIERLAMRTNQSGLKRKYLQVLPNGEKIYSTVEATTLDYYANHGYPHGAHFEGSFVSAAFSLLFWDIIYGTYVEGTFVSEIQTYPLDMFTDHFYLNRRTAISERLDQIQGAWSTEEFEAFLVDNYRKHSHAMGLVKVDSVVDSARKMLTIIKCVHRNVLADILGRLAENYREFHSGFPDLMIWNADTNKAKFVEVKGENDKLSIKQKLWLNFLIQIGADAEVCHVHSTGSKR